jgi:hypothetical protein
MKKNPYLNQAPLTYSGGTHLCHWCPIATYNFVWGRNEQCEWNAQTHNGGKGDESRIRDTAPVVGMSIKSQRYNTPQRATELTLRHQVVEKARTLK